MEGQRRHGQRRSTRGADGDEWPRHLLPQPRPKPHALLTDPPCRVIFLPWIFLPDAPRQRWGARRLLRKKIILRNSTDCRADARYAPRIGECAMTCLTLRRFR